MISFIFAEKLLEAFAVRKLLSFFLPKYLSVLSFRNTARLNKSLTSHFSALTILQTTVPRCNSKHMNGGV